LVLPLTWGDVSRVCGPHVDALARVACEAHRELNRFDLPDPLVLGRFEVVGVSPRGVRVDNGRLHVSSIYTWFKEDFGGSDEAIIAHLRRYAAPALAARLESIKRVAGDSYDWSLNDLE